MNKILIVFARLALTAAYKALSKLNEKQLIDAAQKINAKVDLPGLDEAAEGRIIYRLLSGSVETAKEILNVVKI